MDKAKILYFDLGMGAAGDMLTAALYELLDENARREYIDKINSLGLSDVCVSANKCSRCGISGTHMGVFVSGMSEDEHHHGHHHDHHHVHHEHSKPEDISKIIRSMPVSDTVRKNATAIYGIIAEAESIAHNTDVSMIHFHEVGNKDAIVDIVGFCILMEMLGDPQVVASPVCTGYGKVKCAHGILPVPAPATANILSGVPIYAGDIEGEMCTPTGAAIVKYFASDFRRMPLMCVDKTGYGMGERDYGTANCVRAMLGCKADTEEEIVELSCNVDDMTGEEIGYATDILLKSGAKDVYTTAIGMKKGRPGVMISVMCHPSEKQKFVLLLFKHTTSIGVRENTFGRYTLKRSVNRHDSVYGDVRIKTSEGYGVCRDKIEFDDITRIADESGLGVWEVRNRIGNKMNE